MQHDVLGVLDQLDMPTVALVGHSMGGTVAYLLAQSQPTRVTHLILEYTPLPVRREPSPRPRRPEGPLPFDWAVIPAISAQLDNPDPG